MRLKFVFSFLVLATALVLISCNSTDTIATSQKPAATQVTHADGARRITIDEFDALVKKGEAYIVDVRNQASYDSGHIPGARLIPAGEIANHLNELPRDKMIVTYCS